MQYGNSVLKKCGQEKFHKKFLSNVEDGREKTTMDAIIHTLRRHGKNSY